MIRTLLAIALAATAVPAAALVSGTSGLPQAFYSNGFDTTTFTVIQGQDVTSHVNSDHSSSVTVANDPYFDLGVGVAPTPYITAKAHGGNGVTATGGGSTIYYFEVLGPNGATVPLRSQIDISAVVGGTAGSVEMAGGAVNIYTNIDYVQQSAAAAYPAVAPEKSYARLGDIVDFNATANFGSYNEVVVTAIASVNEQPGESGYAHVYADPFITIDPVWAATHPGFSLQFSPGIGNAPGPGLVPEPASWALLVAGFGMIGALARRRGAGAVRAPAQ